MAHDRLISSTAKEKAQRIFEVSLPTTPEELEESYINKAEFQPGLRQTELLEDYLLICQVGATLHNSGNFEIFRESSLPVPTI